MTRSKLEKILLAWSIKVQKWSIWIILFFVLITGWGFLYVSKNLGVNTDTSDMMSEKLQWRQDSIQFRATFPEEVKTILIVIEGHIPEHAYLAQTDLSVALEKKTDLYESIYVLGGGDFFWKNGLLFLPEKDLKKKIDIWQKMLPLMSILAKNPTIETLALSLATASQKEAQPSETFLKLVTGFNHAIESLEEKKPYTFSWQNVIQDNADDLDASRQVIVVKPILDFKNILPGKAAIQAIREDIQSLDLEGKYDVKVKITGEVALAHEELLSVTEGAGLAAILSMIMVTIILAVSLRSFWLVISSLVTLISGLILTATFAAVAVGSLNLISIAFAVLFIGLGIDFSIHLCLRVREALVHHAKKENAIKIASSDVGGSLVLCAITTSVGFYSFIPTSFAGVSELGLISGTGIIIGLITNLTLLPAILAIAPIKHVPHFATVKNSQIPFFSWPYRYPRAFIWTSVVLVIIAIPFLRYITFVGDPMQLRAQKVESVETFYDLLDSKRFQALKLSMLTPSLEDAKEAKHALEALSTVAGVRILSDWVPEDQPNKLKALKQLGRQYQNARRFANQMPAQSLDIQKTLTQLHLHLEKWEDTENTNIADFRDNISKFLKTYKDATKEQQKIKRERLNESMLATWPIQMERFNDSMQAKEITFDNLPEDLRHRWQNNHLYRVEIFPKNNIKDLNAQKLFVNEVLSVAPNATGLPVIHQKAATSVIDSFVTAFVYALSFITILLFVLFKRWQDVALILIPLLMASLLTGALTVVFNLHFNFANIIALPLLLGIGVDNGIHFVHRYYSRGGATQNLLMTSTGKAVLASTFTTICSFGNLAFSAHVGMSSMGILLALGMTLTLISTFTLLPALLAIRRERKE